MKKSIIYTVVLLTLFAFSFALIPQAHSQTANIKIVSYSWYIDTAGLLDVVGEVENIGTNTVESVILNAQMTTTTGDQQSTQTMVFVKDMLPNQKAPFYMTFFLQADQTTGALPSIANVQILVAQAPTTTGYLYQDIKITAQQHSIGTGTEDKGVYWVTGTVQNTGSQTATNVRVLGTFYDTAGNVIAVGGYTDTALSTSLAPSAKTDFKFGAYDTNETLVSSDQKIASFTLLVQVEDPVLQGTAPLITPGPTVASTPSVNTSPTPSGNTSPTATQPSQTQTNNPTGTTTPAWLIPVVIIIIIAAIIGVTIFAFNKRKSPQISETAEKKK